MERTPFETDLLKWIIENEIWGEEISEDLFPIMEKHGMCERVPYDPEKHDVEGSEYLDKGDLIWWFTPPKE